MILAFSIMALAGCQKKAEEKNVSMESFQELEIKEENNSHRTDEKNSNIGLENLMQEKEYILVEAALLPDSRLLLCYNGDGKYKFAVFDIQSNKILNT